MQRHPKRFYLIVNSPSIPRWTIHIMYDNVLFHVHKLGKGSQSHPRLVTCSSRALSILRPRSTFELPTRRNQKPSELSSSEARRKKFGVWPSGRALPVSIDSNCDIVRLKRSSTFDLGLSWPSVLTIYILIYLCTPCCWVANFVTSALWPSPVNVLYSKEINLRSALTKTSVITLSYSMPEILASLKSSLGSFRASSTIFPWFITRVPPLSQ